MAKQATTAGSVSDPAPDRVPDHGSDQASDPGDRGRLRIADRVVERIAVQAAHEVDGVVRAGSTLDRALGRRYPKADAEVAGDRVRVTMQVATVWPTPLTRAAREVRAAVTEHLSTMVGMHVDSVDVHAAKVVLDDGEQPARRVR